MTADRPPGAAPGMPRSAGRAPLVARLAPAVARHLVTRPYRGGRRAPGATAVHLAAYDAFLELLLAGFTELTGHRVRPQTGSLAVRLNRIAFLVDDEFEARREAGSPLGFTEVLASDAVSGAVHEFRAFLARECRDGQAQAIRDVMWRSAGTAYRAYAEAAQGRIGPPSVDELVVAAHLDSGVVLRQLAEVVGLFCDVGAGPAVLDDFTALGVACKFSDDLRDWRRDRASGADNLLSACLRDHPDEERRAGLRADSGRWMPERWWRTHCPHAFGRFAGLYADRHRAVRSPSLRTAADLMSETGRLGLRAGHDGSSAARVRPEEPA